MATQVITDESGLYDLVISWTDDQSLSVGIQTHDGRPIIEHLAEGEHDEGAQFPSLWGTFNRPSVNRAIRLLRTGRDRVFGKDE